MDKKRTVQRKRGKKKGRPRIRFSFGVMLIIFLLSFLVCFVLYMMAANFNPDFFKDEFDEPAVVGTVAETTAPSAAKSPDAADTASAVSGMNPVPASPAADDSYFENCCLITDAVLLNMGTDGKFAKNNVFGSADLNASNCNAVKIESSFGTENVYDIMKSKKPEIVYIMLGSDLGTSTPEAMISGYSNLISNLRGALPGLKIYVMQLPPVMADREDVTNDMVNDYNARLLSMANSAGVYCIDTNTCLKNGSGTLDEKYWNSESSALSADGCAEICKYILTHIA